MNQVYPVALSSSAVAILRRIEAGAKSAAATYARFPSLTELTLDPSAVVEIEDAFGEIQAGCKIFKQWLADSSPMVREALEALRARDGE